MCGAEARVGGAAVSVALCTYQGASFLEQQLRSICLQTLPPAQIVLSDDASTDGTVELARQVVQDCARKGEGQDIELKVVVNKRPLGVARNFQQAVQSCSEEFIALSDQDDVWASDKLERMVSVLAARPNLLLLHSDARLVGADGQSLGETLFHALEVTSTEITRIHAGRAFDVFLRRNLVTGATALFRRELLNAALPFPAGWLHDEWLGVIAAAVGQVDVMELPLIDYRQHGSNQVGARRDTFLEKVKKALASRGDTHQLRARKAADLLSRLNALREAVAPELVRKVEGKLEHQRFRSALPEARLWRVLPIAREAMTGRYGAYGRGMRGVVRDLFESV